MRGVRASGAVVTVDVGGGAIDCAVPGDTGPSFDCRITEANGRPALVAPTGMADLPDVVVVEIAEAGGAPVRYEVEPDWNDPYYPNGKWCGGSCRSGEAELALGSG